MTLWRTPCGTSTLLLALLLPASVGGQQAEETGSGLRLKAIVVSHDLSLRPVPKRVFLIRGTAQPAVALRVTTDFEGAASLGLIPGSYVLESESPLPFEDSLFTWEIPFEITAGAFLDLELSNDNATIERSAQAAVPINEGELYRRFKGSVFKVLSESGHGSGFLVSSGGLVLTNHHVVANSDYLAVKVDGTRKFPAQLVADDELHDLAVLRIHPDAVAGVVPLELARDAPDQPTVSVGERVVAIGSPLATDTILTSGLVSKVEEGAIYSDVNINQGNSGGPLLSSRGVVIGVNTFAVAGDFGPGVSGIVRIHLAARLVEEASTRLADSAPPPNRLLPVESSFPYPAEDLQRIATSQALVTKTYHLEAGKIDVQFITPVLIAGLDVAAEREASEQRSRRSKGRSVKQYTAGDDFYEWGRYVGDYRPIVTIQAIPEITMTAGSAFAVAMLGPNVPQRYRFKTDFDRMELWRGATLVEPILPGRIAEVVSAQAGLQSLDDIKFYGKYEYPPEAFAPGATLILKVWRQGDASPNDNNLDAALQARVWADFQPYFQALEQAAAAN